MQDAAGFTPRQKSVLFQAYCLTRVDHTRLLQQRQRILADMTVRCLAEWPRDGLQAQLSYKTLIITQQQETACASPLSACQGGAEQAVQRAPCTAPAQKVTRSVLLQSVTNAELDQEHVNTDLTPGLPNHLRGLMQLNANTKDLTKLRLAFALGTWGSVVDPVQMAELALFGGTTIFPSMWCVAMACHKSRCTRAPAIDRCS